MQKNKFYITTPIFYVNAKPHIGHAFTMIASDALARYHSMKGEETFFLTGTDEHGTKIARAAEQAGKETQQFTDEVSQTFQDLATKLSLSNNDFIRTTDQERHWPGVIKLWNLLKEQGDIYKGSYEGLYCVGHEAFIKKSDLVDGLCPDHKTAPEVIAEENYFFALTKYKIQIRSLYETGKIRILPEFRKNEVLNMLDELEDISFSRPRKDLTWGIPVPGDDTQTIYVWCDALTNYLSAIGYGRNNDFEHWWPADVHVIGKDILRFHAIIWPGMLLAAGLSLPKSLLVHGFITVEGEKMSKTIGNVINPMDLLNAHGMDPVRYFMLREIPTNNDGDFSLEKLKARYQGDLANGLGNLVQRVATLVENNLDKELIFNADRVEGETALRDVLDDSRYDESINDFMLHETLAEVWKKITLANVYVNDHKPWVLAKEDQDKFLTVMSALVAMINHIAWLLQPFMPETAGKIFSTFGLVPGREIADGTRSFILKGDPLFPRLG